MAILTGCSGFWDKSSSSSGGTGSASGVFYVLNQGTTQVVGMAFAAGSTTPTAISSGTATLGATPYAIAIAPGGGFLYVSTGGGVFVYSIASSGALTLLNNSQAISPNLPTAMAVDGTGTWLLESLGGSGILYAVPIDASTGLLDTTRNSGNAYSANLPVTILNGIAVSPANSSSPYVFAAMGAGGTEFFPFNASSTGSPFSTRTNIPVINAGGGATAVAVDPTNRLLYVGESVAFTSGTQTGGVRVFTIGSTSMSEISGSPYATAGTGPSAILPLTNYVYVANKAVSGSTTGNITGYPLVSTGGVYSLGSIINTIAAGSSTVGLAEESTGTYLLAVNSGGSPDLNAYTFDSATPGKLVAGATVATGTDPVRAVAIAAVP
jgi:hypothetical protein